MINVECCAGHKNLNENIGARNHMTPYMTYQPHYSRTREDLSHLHPYRQDDRRWLYKTITEDRIVTIPSSPYNTVGTLLSGSRSAERTVARSVCCAHLGSADPGIS